MLPAAAGIALVSGGVITVGLGRHVEPRALVWAGSTGVTIALYTVIDGQGVRAAPSTGSYIVWTYLVALGGGIGGLFAAWRGTAFTVAARTEWRAGLMAGALSIVPYASALAAYRLGGAAHPREGAGAGRNRDGRGDVAAREVRGGSERGREGARGSEREREGKPR